MILKDIFKKPVDRHIEGVIKADDDAQLLQEVEEYVVTNEVMDRLEIFLNAYNNYDGANGAWISGFFGSGKSHLLKMLALLLENRQINDHRVLDMFVEKCSHNAFLLGELKQAVSIPSRSILFNIDQKADVINKTETDALLAVFVKVFNEMCGYYGKLGHIARFERDLDDRNMLFAFKDAFHKVAGKPWEEGREVALLESENIAIAYAAVSEGDPAAYQGILDKYRKEYKVSIEDFAQQVLQYVEKQGKHFRLNFFVDEVGQYIADNVKLMTNLQTISESLSTKCRDRAWIIVTAQEDMEGIIGKDLKDNAAAKSKALVKGNDFSKIQDRFKIRLKLTSTNVEEVIQKRLLTKTDEGHRRLSAVYTQQVNSLPTLFDFTDGGQKMPNFADNTHFVNSYPFIPYQYDLFQLAIRSLSAHDAFEGKHSSVGERSMLGVFQHVAITLADRDVGRLATFDLMFEGIQKALKSQIQHAVLTAEKNLGDVFALKVLKALFLVKYIKEFKATVPNICVLMTDGFQQNIGQLKEKVQAALTYLREQIYIQRNGAEYEFLTDEEKDVEKEINNIELAYGAQTKKLTDIIFDNVITDRKIDFKEYGQFYPYTQKIDNQKSGREHELAIHVITPFYEYYKNKDSIISGSLTADELLIILPEGDLYDDITTYMKTEKYCTQNTSRNQKASIRRILMDKSNQNAERLNEIELRVRDLFESAEYYVKGNLLDTGGATARDRIYKAFHYLITHIYTNLHMLKGAGYKEKNISLYLEPPTLMPGESTQISEAEQEVLAFINRNKSGGNRTTLKNIVDTFERKPYGWYLAGIQCILAKLCACNRIELTSDSMPIEAQALERALSNTHAHQQILAEPQIEFSASQVSQLKTFYEEFFHHPPIANDTKAIGQEISKELELAVRDLREMARQANNITEVFAKSFENAVKTVSAVAGKPYRYYYEEFSAHQDQLLDLMEAFIHPISKFLNSEKKDLLAEAVTFIQAQHHNFSEIEGDDDPHLLSKMIDDPRCYKGDRLKQLGDLLDKLKKKVAQRLRREQDLAKENLKTLEQRLTGMEAFPKIPPEQQNHHLNTFNDMKISIEDTHIIGIIRDKMRQFQENQYPAMLHDVTERAAQADAPPPSPTPTPAPAPAGAGKSVSKESAITAKPAPKIESVHLRAIQPNFPKPWLENEDDAARYMEQLKEALLKHIADGKRILV